MTHELLQWPTDELLCRAMSTANAQSTSPLVILVEDDPFDTAYTLDVMAAVAPQVRVLAFDNLTDALNALAAHTAANENPDFPIVLFLEVGFLDRERDVIAEALRRHKTMLRAQVVAILASDTLAEKQRAFELGADDVLLKPADPAIVARMFQFAGAPAFVAAA